MLSEIFKKPKPNPAALVPEPARLERALRPESEAFGSVILGKVQLLALPGAPGWEGQWDNLVTRAEQEATALATGGVDGLIIENFYDTPYTRGRMDTAGAIAMAMLTRRIKQFTALPVGISVLSNDPEAALAIAINTDADFIRVPLLSGAMVTESGVINNRFNELFHYKNRLKTELPPLLVDISTRHLVLGALNQAGSRLEALVETARALPPQAQDAVLILSDRDIRPEELEDFKRLVSQEVLVENQSAPQEALVYFERANGLILDADVRKTLPATSGSLPTIDMTRVEEMVNLLRKIPTVADMDPDLFLQR